ncbi:hypothetical protein WJX72_001308 [[Myrmecia] bisecta]|uniref:RING-type E3 ubiquitin transferase BRCA1 n=1 Tax=[Myrmecia] bisecta TaxID=41462 RepID=A0AAW1Q0U5_9CHLO
MSDSQTEILALGRSLTCCVCLSVLKPPTARLGCCHYFCLGCITASVKTKAQCPLCKAPCSRRDISRDTKMDRLSRLYSALEAAAGTPLLCTQLPLEAPVVLPTVARMEAGPMDAARLPDATANAASAGQATSWQTASPTSPAGDETDQQLASSPETSLPGLAPFCWLPGPGLARPEPTADCAIPPGCMLPVKQPAQAPHVEAFLDQQAHEAAPCATVANEWQSGITHVICGVEATGRARRTLKYMQGVLAGAWVLDASWLRASLQAGHALPEDAFEVPGDTSGGDGGPILGRLQARHSPLLHGWQVFLVGVFHPKSRDAVLTLTKAAGAKLLTRPPATMPSALQPALADAAAAQLLVVETPLAVVLCDIAAQAEAGRQCRVLPSVDHRWLLDSASCYQVKPLQPYFIAPA